VGEDGGCDEDIGVVDWSWFRRPFHSDCNHGESNNLGEMGAEFGLVCRCFLLPLHPR
jgi:hypothetical protein